MCKNNKCSCGDKKCKRIVKGNKNGKLYIENHFTCGNVKKIINNYKDINLNGLLKDITKENIHQETQTGKSVGKEII